MRASVPVPSAGACVVSARDPISAGPEPAILTAGKSSFKCPGVLLVGQGRERK